MFRVRFLKWPTVKKLKIEILNEFVFIANFTFIIQMFQRKKEDRRFIKFEMNKTSLRILY